ncbi:ATP-binding protein [Streptomyces eurocidicus]|uniref:ATP-binding protein n=1 Tax=Streptomyces eurocidicus TaxID=66423 RepID=UPI001FCFA6F6|nr:ATP-binding protein [Streptomyces eurocidicus]
MSHHIPEVVSWCLAVALVAVAVLLVRQRGITAAVRRRVSALEDGLQARDTEVRHLVAVRLPAVTASMHQPVPLPGLLDERLTGTVFAQGLQSVMETFTQAVDKAQARADQSAKAALKASMRALQGLAHEQQLAISDMQERHDNPDVLRDLLQIDHANSQFGRRAQAISVLCGSWPGRQRSASPLTDVVRGATSRIRDYRRVQVHNQADLAVVSRVVEPVVLAVAELLDNAARHSQPNTTVQVGLQPVHNGACVVIDDAGVGMDGQEVQRAAALLSGQRTVDVSRLGDPPQFGFPVIGVLAARYGFSVSVDTRSPYGGVRAVLFLPSALLVHLEIDGPDTTPLGPPGRTASKGVRHDEVRDAPGSHEVPGMSEAPRASGAAGVPGGADAAGAAFPGQRVPGGVPHAADAFPPPAPRGGPAGPAGHPDPPPPPAVPATPPPWRPPPAPSRPPARPSAPRTATREPSPAPPRAACPSAAAGSPRRAPGRRPPSRPWRSWGWAA